MNDYTNNSSLVAPFRGQPFKKKQLDPYLFSGPKGTADDVRILTGYPIWTLIAQWQAATYKDELLLAGYPDIPIEEWEAAKRYYATHKPFIDAHIIINSQPDADADVPPMQTADEYFTYLAGHNEGSVLEDNRQTSETSDTRQ